METRARERVANAQWIRQRAEEWSQRGPRSVVHAGRVQSGLSCLCFVCLLELSECKGQSYGTHVQNMRATVCRTGCLLTLVHISGVHCLIFFASGLLWESNALCNSLDLTFLLSGWKWATSNCLALWYSLSGSEVLVRSVYSSNFHDLALW